MSASRVPWPCSILFDLSDIRGDAAESNAVLRDLGPEVACLEGSVTDDKISCVYTADDEDVIVEHARCLDVPATRISRVRPVNDPSNAA